ncbi:MAG: SRPBCC domain-containing protein [Actinomycetota bacterium]|nr:SRPBCC domain-containing protein [Actinomycetota bacterium]
MAFAAAPTPSENIAPLSRPPVRQSTIVRSDVDHTFAAFVRMIGAWWPVEPLSVGRDRVRDVTVEEHLGGRVYETWDDGTTVDWGEVVAWEPPGRLVMSWLNTPAPTEVELAFTALGPGLTRVALEHRGWEHLTDEQLREDCAEPGGYQSGAYSRGWLLVLERFAGSVEPEHDG